MGSGLNKIFFFALGVTHQAWRGVRLKKGGPKIRSQWRGSVKGGRLLWVASHLLPKAHVQLVVQTAGAFMKGNKQSVGDVEKRDALLKLLQTHL